MIKFAEEKQINVFDYEVKPHRKLCNKTVNCATNGKLCNKKGVIILFKIEKSIAEYENWCNALGVHTTDDLNNSIKNGHIKDIVNLSEIWHSHKISQVADMIKQNIDTKKLILISGPSSSGKTTFSKSLKLHLAVLGIKSRALSLDDYFFDSSDTPFENLDLTTFDVPEAVDISLLNEHIKMITDGKKVMTPVFDFATRKRIENGKEIKLNENEVIIVEGLHALNEKIASNISDKQKCKVYCTALTTLKKRNGNKISSQRTRLIRRLIRDCKFRASSAHLTFKMWQDVEDAAKKYIYPYSDNADIVFNSSVLYEFGIYKKYVEDIMMSEEIIPKHQIFADKILSVINNFDYIDPSVVPPTSIVREFIGGGSLV